MGLQQHIDDRLVELRDEEQELLADLSHNEKEIRLLKIERTELEDRLERVRKELTNV